MEETDIVMKTKVLSHNSQLNWSIQNATKIPKLLLGEKFSLLPKCKTKLRGAVKILKLSENTVKFGIGFQRMDKCKDDVTVITALRMCDSLGKIHFHRNAKFTMSSKDGNIRWCIAGRFSNKNLAQEKCLNVPSEDSLKTEHSVSYDSEDDNFPYLRKDELVIKGNIKMYGCCIVSDSKTKVSPGDLKETQLAEESVYETINDLKLAFESNLFCDIVLKVDGFEIRAHKFVLCARCPYFMRIICDGKNVNYINIEDMNKRVLEAFLRFLYTGAVGAVQLDTIKKLYAIAEKYEVSFLKKNCSLVMKSEVNNANACDVLVLANEHKDADLKRFVMNFVVDNFSEAEINYKFSTLLRNHAELAAEVMHYKSLRLP